MKNILIGSFLIFSGFSFANDYTTVYQPQVGEGFFKAGISAKINTEDGICRALGFESGVPNSIEELNPGRKSGMGLAAIFDKNGNLVDAGVFSLVESIVCKNFKGSRKQRIEVFSSEFAPYSKGPMISSLSDGSGVCKYLGFNGKGGFRSTIEGGLYGSRADGLIVGKGGAVIGREYGTYASDIVCASKLETSKPLPQIDLVKSVNKAVDTLGEALVSINSQSLSADEIRNLRNLEFSFASGYLKDNVADPTSVNSRLFRSNLGYFAYQIENNKNLLNRLFDEQGLSDLKQRLSVISSSMPELLYYVDNKFLSTGH